MATASSTRWPTGQALPVIARQQTGSFIKEMLREVGTDAPYVQVRYEGAFKHESIIPKWQAVATHTARHTYGALLAKMKVEPLTMRDLLGRSNLSSTMTYVHLEAEATERTVLDGVNKLEAWWGRGQIAPKRCAGVRTNAGYIGLYHAQGLPRQRASSPLVAVRHAVRRMGANSPFSAKRPSAVR